MILLFKGLERCAGEVIADMLEIVETCDPDDAQMQIVMRNAFQNKISHCSCHFSFNYLHVHNAEFPTFLDYYRQIREVEPEYAAKCMTHWKLFMQGPPNKPNKDDYGLIRVSAFPFS